MSRGISFCGGERWGGDLVAYKAPPFFTVGVFDENKRGTAACGRNSGPSYAQPNRGIVGTRGYSAVRAIETKRICQVIL